jgi:hypothetical protein
MSTRIDEFQGVELPTEEWQPHLDHVNKEIERGADVEVTIEVVGDPIVGTEVERLPLDSITHEDGDDQIAIGVGGRGRRYPAVLWHFVDEPRRLVALDDERLPTGMIVESEDETLTLVRLYWP